MKTFKLLVHCIVICSVFFACSDHQSLEWVCSCTQQQKVANFITANTKSANNMSDEEMEDVIKELRQTGIKLHCSQKLMWKTHHGQVNWNKEKLDSCEVHFNIMY
jgi:hypothetical protein